MHPPTVSRATISRLPSGRAAGLGLALSLMVTAPALVGALALDAGLSLAPWMLGGSWLAIAGWHVWSSAGRRRATVDIAACIAVVTLALSLASTVFDLSFDGQYYHETAIRLLAGGWNPVWNSAAAESLPSGMHVVSIPKAAWIVEAMLTQGTGALESAKGLQAIALAAAFLLAWPSLECLGVRRRAAVIVALLAAANPVALQQLQSFYTDGLLASSLVAVLALAVLFAHTQAWRFGCALALALAFVANLKFAGVVYAALIALAVWLTLVRRGTMSARRWMQVASLAAAVAAVEGVNPYLTNTLRHGHPAYPFAGPDAQPIVRQVFYEPTFLAMSAPERVAISLFGESSDDTERAPRWKVPFTLHAQEVGAFTTVDTRIAGWGPWFGGALLLSAVILAFARTSERARSRTLAALSAAFVLTALIVPYGFYARYTPQVWFAALPALLLDDLRGWRTRALAAILAANLAFVATVSTAAQLVTERTHRAQLRALAAQAAGVPVAVTQREAPFENVDLHFAAFGLRTQAAPVAPCAAPAQLLRTHAWMCLADGRSPDPAPDPLRVIEPLRSRLRAVIGARP
ncbi:MAG: hypothetical protein HY084_12735 [Gemmatimonadetes bacterium]|nr:hypothetical protein [Gemmatimonadota bacterium]